MLGINRGDLTIGISTMPYRKKLCLVKQEGNSVYKLATFNDDESAYEFLRKLVEICGMSEYAAQEMEKGIEAHKQDHQK